MVKVIPAHLENGQVVPLAPLPPAGQVRSVSILVEVVEECGERPESTLPKLLGIIKDPGDWKGDYTEYLEEKYR